MIALLPSANLALQGAALFTALALGPAPAALLAASPQRGAVDLVGEVAWFDPAVFTATYMEVGAPSSLQLRLDLSMASGGGGSEHGYAIDVDFSRGFVRDVEFLSGNPTILTDLVVSDGTAGAPDQITYEQSTLIYAGFSAGHVPGRAVLTVVDLEGDAWSGAGLDDLPTPLSFASSPGTSAEMSIFNGAGAAIALVTFSEMEVRDSGEVGCAGAANSSGLPARLFGTGSRAVSDNSFGLVADRLPVNAFGLLIVSDTEGYTPNPGGMNGFLCLAGNIARFVDQVQNSGSAGVISLPIDLTAVPTVFGFEAIQPGETRYFQIWHRDVMGGGSSGPRSNFTESIGVTFL